MMDAETCFRCGYCDHVSSNVFKEVIDHCIDVHCDVPIKATIISEGKTRVKTFNIIPNRIFSLGKIILANNEKLSLKIRRKPETPSPYYLQRKRFKYQSSSKTLSTRKRNFDAADLSSSEDLVMEDIQDLTLEDNAMDYDYLSATRVPPSTKFHMSGTSCYEYEDFVSEVSKMLPSVFEVLTESNKLHMYLKFQELLAMDKLPFDNIAFLLFQDVIEWYSLGKGSCMRYSPEVKQFWRTGYKLFKGRFLRFMGGLKTRGQEGPSTPSESMINFIVPDIKSLEQTCPDFKKMEPGVFTEMISLLKTDDEKQLKTYKLCFDGKKINSGIEGQIGGDVDLWGYEGPVSLKDKQRKAKDDLDSISELELLLSRLESRDLNNVLHASQEYQEEILCKGKNIICKLSQNLSELREVKKKKEIVLEKITKACCNEQMKVKYSYALSAIKTFVYRINGCIGRILKLVDDMGQKLSIINGFSLNYCVGQVCDLNEQNNYFCLTGKNSPDVNKENLKDLDTDFVKQRTKTWENVRKFAKVTGSTCFNALGLGGLKVLKEHFQRVFHNTEKEIPSEIRQRMEHGVQNEINGVATLLSKFMPIYYPDYHFSEKGCETVFHKDQVLLLVSPDGCLRTTGSNEDLNPRIAVEIKCPYPGNVYKNIKRYEIPYYYIPQILSEMAVLQTQKLLYICYTTESSTVLQAEFDEDLWQYIISKIVLLYENDKNPRCPSKLPDHVNELRDRLYKYCRTKVNFIAEVKSVTAKVCNHADESIDSSLVKLNSHISHESNKTKTNCSLNELQSLACEIKDTIRESSLLVRNIASEVLVYLLTDLDRSHNPERYYATPVAYAMKGYSMTCNVARAMVNDVLQECYIGGLYVPVISFDGQWYRIAVRSAKDEPLTLLQLMKDVYKEARSMMKSEIMQGFKQLNLIQVKSQEEAFGQINCSIQLLGNGSFCGPIVLWRKKGTPFLLKTSAVVCALLSEKKCSRSDIVENDQPECQAVDVLNDLPGELVTHIDNDLLINLKSDNDSENVNAKVDMLQTDIAAELKVLFDSEEINTRKTDNQNDQNDEIEAETICESEQDQTDMPCDELCRESDRDIRDTLFKIMFDSIKAECPNKRSKCAHMSFAEFQEATKTINCINDTFLKSDILTCIKSVPQDLNKKNIHFAVSWSKARLAEVLYNVLYSPEMACKPKKKCRMNSLKTLCVMTISKFSKEILNVIQAEHMYPSREAAWHGNSVFENPTYVRGLNEELSWFSKPEYIDERYMHQFCLLDCHHLLTNARTKCCSSGILSAGINKNAWIEVAKQFGCISRALVEDLVDKQSNAFAKKTFSSEVEESMRKLDFHSTADFCKLIRMWYEAEDDPGIDAVERCRRRLDFRTWLLGNIQIGKFPPPGSHVNGIPIVMFEGLMTNIERRIQVFPFVKRGAYNVRALGSLESENFFGAFQDLDPKGSGMLRPDDVASALSTACELTETRFDPERVFYMSTKRAKVYPTHPLGLEAEEGSRLPFLNPVKVTEIIPSNSQFDQPERSNRKPKMKSAEISNPAAPSRGNKGVRDIRFKCDETKIQAQIRMNIDI